MEALYCIYYFAGNCSGTDLQLKLKEYAWERYDKTICTHSAILQIFNDLENHCSEFIKDAPRCLPVFVKMDMPGGVFSECYYIDIRNKKGDIISCLLKFVPLKSIYISNMGVDDIFRGYEIFHENMNLTRIDLNDCKL